MADSPNDTELTLAADAPSNADEGEAQAKANADLVEEVKEYIQFVAEAESDIRKEFIADLKFLSGDQWPDNAKEERNNEGRPCLTINRLPQFIQLVTNDQRQNRPAVRISPRDNQASDKVAELIEGLARDIQNSSNAEVAFDTAFDSAAGPGRGFFRLLTAYVSPESFDQEIIFEPIRNPLAVFFDPSSQKRDGSDAKRAAVVDDLTQDQYKLQYPTSKIASANGDWSVLGNEESEWLQKDGGVRVAEYIKIEYVEKTLHLLGTGETVETKDLADRMAAAFAAKLDGRVVKSKVAQCPVVKWYKVNAVEVLARGEFPGSYIPIIPVYGQEIFINGKRILKGIIRDAKDAQAMYNFWATAETEAIALAPKAPWIVAEGQLEGHAEKWEESNRKNHAFLEYKTVDLDGKPAPPPTRQAVEPAVQAITQARQMSADDLKATTGVSDAGQGSDGQEVSGVAIQKRTNQIGTANFHLVDNLKHSMRHAGKILIEWIPKIYDTARAIRILGEDGSQDIVHINTPMKDENGKDVLYSFNQGRYDVYVDIGPSFASKRQEAAASMQELTRAYPQIMQIAGDLMVKNMDWPGAQELAERLKLTLPPQLQNDGKQPQVPPQAMQLIQMQHQQILQAQAKLNELSKIIETKQIEIQSKERTEAMWVQHENMKVQADLEKTLAQVGSKNAIALLQEEVGAIKHENALLNERFKISSAAQSAPDDFDASEADGGNYPGQGHVGGGPTGGTSPGQPLEPGAP